MTEVKSVIEDVIQDMKIDFKNYRALYKTWDNEFVKCKRRKDTFKRFIKNQWTK